MNVQIPHPPAPDRAGTGSAKVLLVGLLGNFFALSLLWSSHGELDARLEAAAPDIHQVGDRLEVAEAELREMRSTVSKHSEEMHVLKNKELLQLPDLVHLATSGAQHIGKGFAVSRIELEPLGTGTLIRGVMINMQSVGHRSAVFTVRTDDVTHEFTVDVLEAGGSTPFSVYLPRPSATVGPLLRVAFRESTILYRLEGGERPQIAGS